MKSKYLSDYKNEKILRLLQVISKTNANNYFIYDSIYTKFVNNLMFDGKKEPAYRIFFETLNYLKTITRISPLYILRSAIFNSKPLLDVKMITRGRKVLYQPSICSYNVQIQKSIKLIIGMASEVSMPGVSLSFPQKLSISLLNTFLKQGPVYEKVYRMHSFIRERKYQFLKTNVGGFTRVQTKRSKNVRGFYHQNRYSLFGKLKLVKK